MMENNKKNSNIDISKVKHLCNKEPNNTYQMAYLHELFPNAKFVYMIRDGRDMSYSFLKRTEFKNTNITLDRFMFYLNYWNKINSYALNACKSIGPEYCHMVKYEDLVRRPEPVIHSVVDFLGLTWTDEMLHHDRHLIKDIKLSNLSIFSEMQNGKINDKSIGKWRNNVRGVDIALLEEKFYMLKKLNYTNS